jgi:hypothetical protein
MPSVLFYLPVVTPWWFAHIIAPMIRACARDARVGVLVPPLWRGTGIDAQDLARCADLDGVDWYILDGDDHPDLREPGIDHPDLVQFVRELAPDLTLCRSADIANPARFPGMVRYIMEGAAPPFRTGRAWVHLAPTLFDHGMMPPLTAAERDRLRDLIRPFGHEARARATQADRAAFLDAAGLPRDRRVIGVALEYEHPEVSFAARRPFPGNVDLIAALAPRLGDDCVLACTNHPLNDLHGDTRPLQAAIAVHGGRVRLLPPQGAAGDATLALARHADGFVVQDSKSFGGAAFFGTPLLRLSRFRTGAWMRAQHAIAPFLTAVRGGTAVGADAEDAALWFAHHLLDRVFDPADPALDAATLFDYAGGAADPGRWGAAIDRLRACDPPARPRTRREDLTAKEACHV